VDPKPKPNAVVISLAGVQGPKVEGLFPFDRVVAMGGADALSGFAAWVFGYSQCHDGLVNRSMSLVLVPGLFTT
jgi:hypothetical protein